MISREEWKIDLDELEAVLGVWFFFSPWMFAGMVSGWSIALMSGLGLLICADGMWALAKPAVKSPEWVMVALGAIVVASPWLLGLMGEAALAWNAWIVGVALIALAVLTFMTKIEGESKTPRTAH